MYIYIYIHIERERERKKERKKIYVHNKYREGVMREWVCVREREASENVRDREKIRNTGRERGRE